jgi:HEPN domain-containing protein
MNLVERNDKAGFAPFDLSQTPKFDRSADKVELAIRSYDIASKYFIAAKLLFEKSFEYMPVVLTNIAFSCELYLKALLCGCNIDFGNTHGLKFLFDKLPRNIQDYVAQNIAIENRETEFALCLAEQNDAFITYRYMNEVKSITAHPVFLFAFAHILKFVYEALAEEQDKHVE